MNNKGFQLAEYKDLVVRFRVVVLLVSADLLLGAFVYHYVEGLSWLDAVYFCVISLATVGYGDITPTTGIGKVFTIFYVLSGIGIIGVFINTLVKRVATRQQQKKKPTD